MNKIIAAFAENSVFANIIMVIILLGGIISSQMMARESMPDMELDIITISVVYPGADPEEVEEGVTRKIEEAIDGLAGMDKIVATSSEGSSSVRIDVADGFDPEALVNRIRNEVDGISTFPTDAESPSVVRVEKKDAVMSLALTGPMSERRMKEWSRVIKTELTGISGVSSVEVVGTRSYEITAAISRENLRKYGLSISDVADAVKSSSLNKSGGLVKTQSEEIRVRTTGRKYTGEELSSVAVIAGENGSRVTLGDIAQIRDGFTENDLKMKVNGEPAVLLNLFSTGGDTIDISDRVVTFIQEKQLILPEGSEISVMSDNTTEIRSGLNNLVNNALIGLALVFILLWLFMNTKISFWAGMGIPISLMGGLAIINMLGQTINNITLFGLIMVLGIVADDAIIVGEAIYVQRKKAGSTHVKYIPSQ